jgi:hypothetical protein
MIARGERCSRSESASLAEARPFYETLLPALEFTRNVGIDSWLQFEPVDPSRPTDFLAPSNALLISE